MYTEMSNIDFVNMMNSKVHPEDDPSVASIMDEAGRRIMDLEKQVLAWQAAADWIGATDPDEFINYIISTGSS